MQRKKVLKRVRVTHIGWPVRLVLFKGLLDRHAPYVFAWIGLRYCEWYFLPRPSRVLYRCCDDRYEWVEVKNDIDIIDYVAYDIVATVVSLLPRRPPIPDEDEEISICTNHRPLFERLQQILSA